MILLDTCRGDLSFSKNASLCLSVLDRGSCFSTGSWLEGTIFCHNRNILSFAGAGDGIKNLSSTDRVHLHLQSIDQSINLPFYRMFLEYSFFVALIRQQNRQAKCRVWFVSQIKNKAALDVCHSSCDFISSYPLSDTADVQG